MQLRLVDLQRDGRTVAFLVGNIFRIDARRPTSQNFNMDVLRTDGRPLAFFRATGAFQYSDMGMFVLTEFFAAKTNLAALSPVIHVKTAADVDAVLAQTFPQYVPVYKFPLSKFPPFKVLFKI
jgi:hypothetical protein